MIEYTSTSALDRNHMTANNIRKHWSTIGVYVDLLWDDGAKVVTSFDTHAEADDFIKQMGWTPQ